mmetsp:Transcript_14205/g.34525  ORF Transcript_14205/g.34525 Transcript_14205/m.34525 type:complete len:375 (-) Transcript_14205:37-1161(-)
MLRGLGQDGGPQLRGDLLQVQRHLLLVRALSNASQLGERVALALLEQAGQVLVSSSRDIRAGQDIDGLTNSFNLLATKLLALLEILALHGALGRQVAEVLAVCSQIRLLIGLLAHRLSRALLLVGLALCLPGSLLLCAFNLVIQGLDHHLVVVLLIQLLLLEVTQLGPELVFQVLQHVNDPTGMALVSRSFRGLHPRPDGIRLLLQESHDPLLRGHGQESLGGHSNLQQGVLRLGLAVHLLQGRDRSADCVQALAVVRVGRRVVRRLLTPHLRTSLLVNFVRLHLLVKRGDLLAQNPDISVQLADLRLQGSNHLLGLLDRMRLDIVGCTAPLLELGKANLFILLLLLALGKHALQELYNFRGGRHTCRRRTQSQ